MNQWLNPLKGGTGSNLADMGRATVRVDLYLRERRLRNRLLMPVGRPSLRYCGFGDGEAVAAELGADPANRHAVNVGTRSEPPFPLSIQDGGGQAHRQLMAPAGGGGFVVVRVGESPIHGEGTQRVRSRCDGMPGVRW